MAVQRDCSGCIQYLKAVLTEGELQLIGATTVTSLQKIYRKRLCLERRFQPIFVDEPSEEESITISKLRSRYENITGRITDDALGQL